MMMILCCLSAYSECAPGNDACVTDPFRCLFMAASAEKEDMICLNDRLGDVVLKVEKLRSGSGQDSSTFITAIDCLKEEIKRIKTAYDLELSRLRYALNDSAFAQILPIRPSYTHSIHQTTFSDNAVQPVNRRTVRPGLRSENSQNYYVPRVRIFLRRTSRLEQSTAVHSC